MVRLVQNKVWRGVKWEAERRANWKTRQERRKELWGSVLWRVRWRVERGVEEIQEQVQNG